jgi:hypothetical protein
MSILFYIFATQIAFSAEAATQQETKQSRKEPTTAEKVDKSLSEGIQTFKKQFMTAEEEKSSEKARGEKSRAAKSKKGGNDLEKAADSLNSAWDGVLKGVGKILGTQDTEENPKKSGEK